MASSSTNLGFSKPTNVILAAIRAVSYLKVHSHALEDSILRRLIASGPTSSSVTHCSTCNDESVDKCLQMLTLLTTSELQLVLKKSVQTGRTSPSPNYPAGKTPFKPSLDWKRRPPLTSYSYNLMKFKVKEALTRKYGKNNPNIAKLTMQEVAFFNPVVGLPMADYKRERPDSSVISRKLSSRGNSKSSEHATRIQKDDQVLSLEPNANKSNPVPQVKINDKGEVIIDPDSLRFQTPEAAQIEENASGIQSEQLSHKCEIKWDFKDLVKFYRGLFLFGTDFSLLADFFPGRSRKNLKAKFKSEEKRNRDLVDRAVHSVKRSRADLVEIIRLLKVDSVLKSCNEL